MYFKNFDDFFERVEEFLKRDPFRTRVVLKSRMEDNVAVFKVTNDIRTIAMKFYKKEDVKKIEALIFKATEILANVKNDGSYQAISGGLTTKKRRRNRKKRR